MGIKYEWRTLDDVESIIEGLAKATENLTSITTQMRANRMEKVLLAWAQRHWDAYDLITTVAATCASMVPAQVDAKRQNRPSKYEKAIKQSAQDAQTRRTKQGPAELEEPPKKPRGRPRKGTT